HLEHQSRALPRRARGAQGGRVWTGRHALGDDARGHLPLRPRRHRLGDDPRARPCTRRGHRRLLRYRCVQRPEPREPVRARQHDRRLARERILEFRFQARDLVSFLPRRDPPGLFAPREPRGAAHRASGGQAPGTGGLMSAVELNLLQRPNDRLRRRRLVSRCMELLAWLAAAVAVAILGIVVWSVAKRGASELNLNLLTKPPIPFSTAPQGLVNAFVGSLVMVGLATLMALPVGILIAIYVNEFAPRLVRRGVGLTLDILNGVP